MKAWHEAVILVVASALLYLTGTAEVPFYTRGEPREGLVVQEMLRTGDWLVPARPGGDLAKKPPLYYWAAAAAATALPDPPERAMRLPSALLGLVGVLATWVAARRVLPAGGALPAALVLATSFEWARAANSARVDMALATPLAVVLAAWSIAVARPDGAGRGALVAVAIAGAAFAVLGKGPVGLVMPALAAGALLLLPSRRGAALRLRPVTTLAVAGLVAALWYGAAYARHGAAFLDVVARENVARFVDADAGKVGHAHGIFYLPVLALVGFLPWTPILPLALAAPRSPATALAGAWTATGAAFLSLASSKRSVYLLPLYPAVALLVAGGATAPADARVVRWARRAAQVYAPVFGLLAVVAAAAALGVDVTAPIRPLLKGDDAASATDVVAAARAAGPALLILGLWTAGAAVACARAVRAQAWRRLLLVVAAAVVAWIGFFNAAIHPAIGRGRSVRDFLARVGTIVPADSPLYARLPPDHAVRFYAPRDLVRWPERQGVDGWVLLWEDEWRTLRDARGESLDVIAVSDSTVPRHGHLALIRATGPVHRAPKEPPHPPAPPGLRTAPQSPQ